MPITIKAMTPVCPCSEVELMYVPVLMGKQLADLKHVFTLGNTGKNRSVPLLLGGDRDQVSLSPVSSQF